jgi:pantoate--beta-alanine ligase
MWHDARWPFADYRVCAYRFAMRVFQTIAEVRSARGFEPLALVPTMGALHTGHLSLMHVAEAKAAAVAVSIFVNPTQFGRGEDFTRYPRPLESDLAKCEAAGVDWVFVPGEGEMYPGNSPAIVIDLPMVDNVLEGKHRPGHFRGVCQVVAKLFNIVQPSVACFGQKDFQQLRVLTSMVEALNWPIEMVACPTLRDPDGLAMSSRNQYLSPSDRQKALSISKTLFNSQEMVAGGIKQASRLITKMQQDLLAQHLSIDYVAAVDPLTLKSVELMTGPTVLAIAVRVGATRLIDNVIVSPV